MKKNLDDTAGALSLGYNHLNTFFRIFILYSLKSDYAVAVTFCSITQNCRKLMICWKLSDVSFIHRLISTHHFNRLSVLSSSFCQCKTSIWICPISITSIFQASNWTVSSIGWRLDTELSWLETELVTPADILCDYAPLPVNHLTPTTWSDEGLP